MNLSASEKAAIYDYVDTKRYEGIIRIHVSDGMAETLHSTNRDLNTTLDHAFPFETVMERYIMKRSVDADPQEIVRSLRIAHIQGELRREPVYFTHFIIKDTDLSQEDTRLQMKRVAFHRGDSAGETIVMTSEDITAVFGEISAQSRKLEKALQRLRSDLNEKTGFLRLLDDKVRMPLFSLMGTSQIRKESVTEASAVDDYLRKVSMSGTYMKEVIDDLIDLRRITRDELVLRPKDILLADLIDQVRNVIQPDIKAKGLLFTLDADDVLFLTINADPVIMRRVMVKLLKSTMTYAVQGGRITFRLRNVYTQNNVATLQLAVESRGLVLDRARLQSLLRPHSYIKGADEIDIGSVDLDLIVLRQYLLLLGVDTITVSSDELTGTLVEIMLNVPLAGGAAT